MRGYAECRRKTRPPNKEPASTWWNPVWCGKSRMPPRHGVLSWITRYFSKTRSQSGPEHLVIKFAACTRGWFCKQCWLPRISWCLTKGMSSLSRYGLFAEKPWVCVCKTRVQQGGARATRRVSTICPRRRTEPPAPVHTDGRSTLTAPPFCLSDWPGKHGQDKGHRQYLFHPFRILKATYQWNPTGFVFVCLAYFASRYSL